MPGIIRVKIIDGCDFPIMDRASDLTDAFVEIKIGSTTQKTEVCRKSLNPEWNTDWFRFEVDDEELQDELLTLKVLDYDVYSAHDVIGKVYIDLNPLLIKDGVNSINGWFPIYDTMHGVRGYLQVKVKLEFFEDTNKFKQTSCGVRFFSSRCIPSGYVATSLEGFVDELVVNHDPEYQWIDKIRTPRASNEARLRLFTKLAGELKRKIGLKVIDGGGNAVIGYQQSFDLEGETGVVARGIGTSVTLTKSKARSGSGVWFLGNQHTQLSGVSSSGEDSSLKKTSDVHHLSSAAAYQQHLTTNRLHGLLMRQLRTLSTSSDGEYSIDKPSVLIACSTSPEAIAFSATEKPAAISRGASMMAHTKKLVDDLEFPFFTLSSTPSGFLVHIGGIVSVRSVKLFDALDESDGGISRLSWWHEIRSEIRSHCKSLGCNTVIGYSESTSICDDVIILSASGTAVVTRQSEMTPLDAELLTGSDHVFANDVVAEDDNIEEDKNKIPSSDNHIEPQCPVPSCHLCHLPFVDADLPNDLSGRRCMQCRNEMVPNVLFATIDLPTEAVVMGDGCFIQARVCRVKKKEKGESNAETVSQVLPFVEYELHQQMMNKLKIKGMNALFGVQSQISVGDQALIGIMSGTALFLAALPPPPVLRVTGSKHSNVDNDRKLMEIQKRIFDISTKNRTRYGVGDGVNSSNCLAQSNQAQQISKPSDSNTEESKSDCRGHLDLLSGAKDALVLEVDDKTDEEVLSLTADGTLEEGMCCYSLDCVSHDVPALFNGRPQLFTLFQRTRLEDESRTTHYVTQICDNLLQRLLFKVRRFRPCCVNRVSFLTGIPDDDCFQVTLTACVIPLKEKTNQSVGMKRQKQTRVSVCDDFVFPIDVAETQRNDPTTLLSDPAIATEEHRSQVDSTPDLSSTWPCSDFTSQKQRLPTIEAPLNRSNDVILTPLAEFPHITIDSYVGHLNLFLIRESTSVKEDGGYNMFMQLFIAETYAVLKAHALAVGANAVVSFELNQIILLDSPHKNQAQCLLNVSGDLAIVNNEIFEEKTDILINSKRKKTSSSSVGGGCYVKFDNTDTDFIATKRPSMETQV